MVNTKPRCNLSNTITFGPCPAQAILQKAAASAIAAAAAATGPQALAAAALASHAFSPQHTTMQLDVSSLAGEGALEGAPADGGGSLPLTPPTSDSAAAAAASLAAAVSLHSHQISPSWSEVITSAVNLDLTPPGAAAGAAGAADAATSAALGYHSAAAPAGAQPHSGSNHQTQGGAAVSSAANHHGHGHGQQGQQQGQPGQAHSLESVDGAGHSTTSLRSVNDPLV